MPIGCAEVLVRPGTYPPDATTLADYETWRAGRRRPQESA
jgi:hypothetical protein